MPRFTYRAKDHTRRVVEGTIEADSEATAISRLGDQGVYPFLIVEASARPSSPWSGSPRRVSQQTLAYATHQLADLLGGGLPLLGALTLLASQTEHPSLARVIDSVAMSVRDGRALSDSLSDFPTVFPPLYVSMVRAGEVGGGLEQTLTRLAELGEHEEELRSRVKSAAAYPLFVLGFALLMTMFLLSYVIPKLSLVFLETGQLLPLPTRLLLGVSGLFTRWWWALALGGGLAAWGVRRWYATPAGRAAIDQMLIAIPAFGALVRRMETARFSRNLGIMIGQGVPILTALDVVAENIANSTLRAAVVRTRDAVRDGVSLATALGSTKQFPVFVGNMVAVGQESGRMDAALLKVASAYERDADRTIRTLTTILEPVLLVAVGGIVMFIVLAMLLPVFQIGLGVQ